MKRSIPGLKDSTGAYCPPEGAKKDTPRVSAPAVDPDLSLDDILKRQLTALNRITIQLTTRSASGDMTKDEIQSLATCIKVTLELKAKESELLDDLTDEELYKAVNDNLQGS